MNVIGLLNLFALPRASTFAQNFEILYDFIFWTCWIAFIGIVGALVFFIWRYRRTRRDPEKTPYIEGHTPLELAVSAILLVWVMVIFAWGWVDYVKIVYPPIDTMEINVIGRQWRWDFEYTNGRQLVNELVVPRGKKVKLIMSSMDVIHSFYVPSFRIKQDLFAGAYTTLWFETTAVGEYKIFCAEYCGTSHSAMLGKIKVVEPAEYEHWQQAWELAEQLGVTSAAAAETGAPAGGAVSLEARGQALFTTKSCNTCHTVDGKPLVGPTFKGIFGHAVELADGKSVTVDENYVRESLMDPQAKIVKGFPPVMPTYRGQLTDDEVNALVGYIKSLK